MTEPLRSATVFSLAADPPRAHTDAGEAHAEFDAAVLLGPESRLSCSLAKLSTAGATLRLEESLPEDAFTSLELANGQSLPGRIDWHADGEAGFHFDEPVDVIGTLARTLARLSDERRRMPRVELNQTASIRHGTKVAHARARNISQGGVGLETTLALSEGDPVQVTLDGLRPLDGVVRWVRTGQAGVAFAEELGWQLLMPWLRHAQQNGSPPSQAAPRQGEGMIPDKHAIRLDAPAQVRSGVQWWNARVCAITNQLVELQTRATVRAGAQLWVSLPEIGGGPASVIEVSGDHILCEFRLPLREGAIGALSIGPQSS